MQGYFRSHNSTVRKLEIQAWAREDKSIYQRLKAILVRPKCKTAHLIVPNGTNYHITLLGKCSVKAVFNLFHYTNEFMMPEIG